MSYFDSIVVPNQTTPKKTGGNFFDQILLPKNQAQANKIFDLQHEQQIAESQSTYDNSFVGTVKNAAIDLGGKIAKVPVDFLSSLYNTYNETPNKIATGVSEAAGDLNKAKFTDLFGINTGLPGSGIFNGNTGKGVTKAALRPAADFATAVYAPISAAIGSALSATGGQKLIDKTGEVIADSSGITDVPAFQNYAINHPNAGADFERLLTLAMTGADRSQIDPSRLKTEVSTVVKKLIPGARDVPADFAKPVSSGPADVSTVVNEHIASAKQVIDNLPASELDSLGGISGLLESAKSDIVQALDAYKLHDASVAISKINTVGIKTVAEFADAIHSAQPTASGYFDNIVIPRVSGEPVKINAKQPATEVQVGGPEKVPNTRAVALDKAATIKKLTEGLGELPTHDRMNLVEQGNRATDFVESNPTEAMRVASGDTLPPQGILAESVYTALEAKAIREGDVTTIKELSQSKVPTLAGQQLKALDSVDPNSPVKILRDIQTALEEKMVKKTGMKTAKAKEVVVKEIKQSLDESTTKRPTWEKFIEDLTCGI